MTETVAEILTAYRSGAATPADMVARSYARIRAHNDAAIFITLRDEKDVLADAKALAESGDPSLPLYGIPVTVKDNIDVAGMPTTAACPDYLYRARRDSTAVARHARSGRAHSRQDQSRSIRDRPRRRAHPLWHRPQSVRPKTHPRRLEHRFGAIGRGGFCAACRSAPTPRDPAACRPPSAISSG